MAKINSNATQQIGRTVAESEPDWPSRRTPPPHAPNVVVIVLDDVGFAQYGCFGSSIHTPAIDRLAQEGLRYTNFHTTPLCSPTRASLLTGRNCHSVGFGQIVERQAGYPGYSMQIPESTATLAEILQYNGYSTRAVGKWHLVPPNETGPQGPFNCWPLGLGFDRYYGFVGASTDQFAPELYRDNSPTDPPAHPENGYHLSADLVDESIRQVSELHAASPQRPFFLYLAFGACHSPHQAPREWIDRYRGVFDAGWDTEREAILQRQIDLGVLPPDTSLGASNPGVPRWASLSVDEQRVAARMMEVYAGFLSHTDAQIGRLLSLLDGIGEADNTLIMLCSDNGASAEGGREGSVDDGLYINGEPQRTEDALEYMDELGGQKLQNHYPWGWAQAGNTPFPWYKQFTHAGGIRNGLLVRWPGGGLPAGGVRRQYHHVIDVAPTILQAAGVRVPDQLRGTTQEPMHGVSMTYSFLAEEAEGQRRTQHYEMFGNRGFWYDGWMAISRLQPDTQGTLPPMPMRAPFDDLPWELYDEYADPSQRHDLAAKKPEVLRQLMDLWWAAAGQYGVLPVDTRHRSERWPDPPLPAGATPDRMVFTRPGGPYERGVAPKIAGRSFTLTADVTIPTEDADGALYTVGGRHGGYCWYLRGGEMRLEVARSSIHTETASAIAPLPAGRHLLELRMTAASDLSGAVQFLVNHTEVGGGYIGTLLRRVPISSGRTYIGTAIAPTVSGAFGVPFDFDGVLHRLTVEPGKPLVGPVTTWNAELREQ